PICKAREQAAKRICATCPVRTQCLTHALTYPEAYGIWGGLNEHELVAERCRRGLKPAPRSDYHRVITSAGCNNTKPHNGRGPDRQPLCAACRFRRVQAGRPATVPPPPTRKKAAYPCAATPPSPPTERAAPVRPATPTHAPMNPSVDAAAASERLPPTSWTLPPSDSTCGSSCVLACPIGTSTPCSASTSTPCSTSPSSE